MFNADVITLLVVVAWAAIGAKVVRHRRRHRKLELENTSILMSYYTEDVQLVPVKTGIIGDMHYTAIATLPGPTKTGTENASMLLRVELPFHSKVHLLGIPKKSGATQLVPDGGKSLMERVDLEGDYNTYFSLFAEKDMQTQSRYVLDPKAMAFTIDFCQSHNWEILGSELYFVQATANTAGDKTYLMDDVVTFVKEIEPAIKTPLSESEIKLRTPYNQERRDDLHCPLCNSLLKNESSFYACPLEHGFLVNGSVLAQINAGTVVLPVTQQAKSTTRSKALTCPSCGNSMEQIAYKGGATIIDTCAKCPYRWIDNGELQAGNS